MPQFDLGESKYYDFFKSAGWVDEELNTVGKVIGKKNVNLDKIKNLCNEIYNSPEDSTEYDAATYLVAEQIRNFSDEGFRAIVNGVVCEHVRRKLGVLAKPAFVSAAIERVFRTSVKGESLLLHVERFPSELKKLLVDNSNRFAPFSQNELPALLDGLKGAPYDISEKIVALLDNPKAQQRIKLMLAQLEPSKLPEAFAGFLRANELKTHKWTTKPAATHWEFGIIRKIREFSIWQKFIFTGAQSSIWPEEKDVEQKDKPVIKERGLLKNEPHLAELRKIGGKELFLENPDGEKIHTMEFGADDFVAYVKEALGQLELVSDANQKRVYKMPEVPGEAIENLISLEILQKDGNTLVLHTPPKAEGSKEPSTAILCTGSGVWFSVYKKMIARLLLNGVNVQTFSYRGHELSEGIPTDKKLFQDVETVGHYLREKNVSDKNTLLYASCMGLGPASMYVKNHPECDIFIDRSFASLSSVAAQKIEEGATAIPRPLRTVASKVAGVALPLFVNFENEKALQNAKGNIAVVVGGQDKMLGELADKWENMPSFSRIDAANWSHSGNWLRDSSVRTKFEGFLVKSGHARNLGL